MKYPTSVVVSLNEAIRDYLNLFCPDVVALCEPALLQAPVKTFFDAVQENPLLQAWGASQKKRETSFTCEFGGCGMTFSRFYNLKRHQAVHIPVEKTHCCEVCQKCFTRPSDLKVHRRSHDDAKPYQCVFCHKYFARLSSCRVHERSHTGINVPATEGDRDGDDVNSAGFSLPEGCWDENGPCAMALAQTTRTPPCMMNIENLLQMGCRGDESESGSHEVPNEEGTGFEPELVIHHDAHRTDATAESMITTATTVAPTHGGMQHDHGIHSDESRPHHHHDEYVIYNDCAACQGVCNDLGMAHGDGAGSMPSCIAESTYGYKTACEQYGHVHGPGCGHASVAHEDHMDYLVDGELHHCHDGHCHVHGTYDPGYAAPAPAAQASW